MGARSRSFTTRLTSGIGLLAVPALLATLAHAQTTKIAQSAGAQVEFPTTLRGGFEEPTITGFAFLTTWGPWTMASAGIANNGSTITASNPQAPQGTRVAFLQGVSSATVPFQFQPGTWRLKFKGAQRTNGVSTDQQVLRVTIGSTEVFEQKLSGSSYAEYATRAVTIGSTTSLVVRFDALDPLALNHTALIDEVRIEPIAPWGSNSTWGGAPPQSQDTVSIPSGVEVGLIGTATALTINVQGELLASDRDAKLDTESVVVSGPGARFEAGHELAPYQQSLTVTLHGSPAPGVNTKNLMAMDAGTIDLHGIPRDFDAGGGRRRAWTKLNQDAVAGSMSIQVAEPVTWQTGDRIVIAGSNLVFPEDPSGHWNEAEEVGIKTVQPNGLDIDLDQPLNFDHYGSTTPPFSNGTRSWSLDERAEVGLLTHNIKVQGDPNSDDSLWGAHVMIMRGPCCTSGQGGIGRFSSVEFFRMGQNQELGRYPIHWHMLLDQGAGQYAKSCGIRNSHNRAITIHGSEHVLLEGNVAYDHMGHGIFLEDGSERFNKLYHNLALGTRRPTDNEVMLPSDNQFAVFQSRSPATFWITNPNNEFVGNVAAGTVGCGFWFIFSENPSGLSSTNPYFNGLLPDKEPLGLFTDNVCHSSGTGFDVHDKVNSNHEVVPNHRWVPTTTAPQHIDRLTIYGCDMGIYTGSFGTYALNAPGLDQIRFREAVLADNASHIAMAGYDVLESSCVIARSGSPISPVATLAYVIYDGPGRLFDSHFVGFNGTAESIFSHIGAATRHVNHRFRNLTFDATPTMGFLNDLGDPGIWGVAIAYEYGPGSAMGTIVNNHPIMRTPWDTKYSKPHPWTQGSPPLALVPYISPFKFAHLRIWHPALTTGLPPYNSVPAITLTRFLTGQPDVTALHNYNQFGHRQFPIVMNGPSNAPDFSYTLDWASAPAQNPVIIHLDDKDTDWVPLGSHVQLDLNPLVPLGNLQVKSNGVTLTRLASPQLLATATTTAYALLGSTIQVRVFSTARAEEIEVTW